MSSTNPIDDVAKLVNDGSVKLNINDFLNLIKSYKQGY